MVAPLEARAGQQFSPVAGTWVPATEMFFVGGATPGSLPLTCVYGFNNDCHSLLEYQGTAFLPTAGAWMAAWGDLSSGALQLYYVTYT